MDFVRRHFGKMKLWPVEHFWLTFFPDQLKISTDLENKWAKSVQLVRVSFFRSDFLQNPYFCPRITYEFCCQMSGSNVFKFYRDCRIYCRAGFNSTINDSQIENECLPWSPSESLRSGSSNSSSEKCSSTDWINLCRWFQPSLRFVWPWLFII